MGLDNGFYVRSNYRHLNRRMLPSGIIYPFDDVWEEHMEISYHRKDWGWRNSIMNTFNWKDTNMMTDEEYDALHDHHCVLETPEQVMKLIELTASWMDEEKWENEGDSIWDYQTAREHLMKDLINFTLIYGFMQTNPDVYLEFYDSY